MEMLPEHEPNVISVQSNDCAFEIHLKSPGKQYVDQADCEQQFENTVHFENISMDTLEYRATNYSQTLRGKFYHSGKQTSLELKFN
jgi:hypothetical protein